MSDLVPSTVALDLAGLGLDPYDTVEIDFPWPENGGGKIKRGADAHYPTMTLRQIYSMAEKIGKLGAENSHCYLWVTNNYMLHGFYVLQLMGYRFVTVVTWEKEGRMGLGQYFRGCTEHILFAVRGKVPYQIGPDGKRGQGKTLVMSEPGEAPDAEVELLGEMSDSIRVPRGRHSAKPRDFRAMIERVSPGPRRLTVFCRGTPPEGWDGWGNECTPLSPTAVAVLGDPL